MRTPDLTTLQRIVAQACKAPSVHNTQPWRWVADSSGLDLFTDNHRQLMYADPRGRDLVLSCGAALQHLVVAAAAEGWGCRVRRVPDVTDPAHLARLTFFPRPASAGQLRRAGDIDRRRTDRRQVSSWPVPSGTLDQLVRVAQAHGALASTVDESALRRPLLASMREHGRNESYLDELLAWTQGRGGSGVPTTSLLTSEAAERQPAGYRRFPGGSLSDDYQEDARSQPTWMLLSTSSDDPLSWLRAGEALSATWLSCTADGLSVVPFSQPIEVDSTRATLQAELLGDSSCPQLLLRIGWPPFDSDLVAETPRLPVESVLDARELG